MIPTDEQIIAWIQMHGLLVAACQFMYSCMIQALPAPVVSGSRVYLFLYRLAHLFAGNTGLVVKPPKGTL